MNGAQDLGGMMGFGPVAPENDEPYFHSEWEKRALGLTIAMGATGEWNLDASRHARETLHPADYLNKSYYEIWLAGLEKLMAMRGLLSPEEIAQENVIGAPKSVARILKAENTAAALARGGPTDRPANAPAKFRPGDRVRTIAEHGFGHTRLPRYARGKVGTIDMAHGAFVFPDTNAHFKGEHPQWVYTVVFEGRELWGREADPALKISIDAWEPYLEPA